MTNWNYALSALGATATDSGHAGSQTGGLTIDGSDVTYWEVGNINQYVTIDLGASQYITEIRMLSLHASAYVTELVLSYSVDGVTYIPIGRFSYLPESASINTGGLTGRYWRVQASSGSGSGWRVQTIQVVGPVEAPPPPENPAPDYIDAWLDGLEANYVPTVQDWLDANP